MSLRPWAVVPAKSFQHGKSRLAPVLEPGARAALSRALLDHVLAVLERCPIEGVVVLTDSDEVAAFARRHGADVRREDAPAPLSQIVDGGLRHVTERGGGAALVVMGDLPRLAPPELMLLLGGLANADVVIAPDYRDAGTGALALAPPEALHTCFGTEDSFARHVAAAEAAGLRVAVHRSPGLAFDLDGPDDHRRLPLRARR